MQFVLLRTASRFPKLSRVPLEKLTLEQFRALPAPDDAPCIRPGDAVAWWVNRARGRAGVVIETDETWNYLVLERGDDAVYRWCGLGGGFTSMAHATAELHRRIDDPPHSPLARFPDPPA